MAPVRFPIAETFVSLNGEGRAAGYPACFIRMQGCNLACGYCDTAWANDPEIACEHRGLDELVDWVAASGCAHVTLTGGEPTLQPELPQLIVALAALDAIDGVEVETNGATDLAPLFALRNTAGPAAEKLSLTVDYKLPSSGMESAMIPAAYERVGAADAVKFVVGDRTDLEAMERVIEAYDLARRTMVIASPVFGAIGPATIAAFLIERRLVHVRLQLQLHKIIWPERERGV